MTRQAQCRLLIICALLVVLAVAYSWLFQVVKW